MAKPLPRNVALNIILFGKVSGKSETAQQPTPACTLVNTSVDSSYSPKVFTRFAPRLILCSYSSTYSVLKLK